MQLSRTPMNSAVLLLQTRPSNLHVCYRSYVRLIIQPKPQ